MHASNIGYNVCCICSNRDRATLACRQASHSLHLLGQHPMVAGWHTAHNLTANCSPLQVFMQAVSRYGIHYTKPSEAVLSSQTSS